MLQRPLQQLKTERRSLMRSLWPLRPDSLEAELLELLVELLCIRLRQLVKLCESDALPGPCSNRRAASEHQRAANRDQSAEALHRPGGQDSSLFGNGRRDSGRRRTHNVLLRDMRRNDRRTPPSAEVLSSDSTRAGGLHMALPSSAGRHAATDHLCCLRPRYTCLLL